jgi:hypothetical protein
MSAISALQGTVRVDVLRRPDRIARHVGAAHRPAVDSPAYQRQLVAGDVVVSEIEGIGTMKLGIRNA